MSVNKTLLVFTELTGGCRTTQSVDCYSGENAGCHRGPGSGTGTSFSGRDEVDEGTKHAGSFVPVIGCGIYP